MAGAEVGEAFSSSDEGKAYQNVALLAGHVSSAPITRDVPGTPPQLQVYLDIVMAAGFPPMVQPVIFVSPSLELVEEAMAARGRWAICAAEIWTVPSGDQVETRIIGMDIRFVDRE